MATIILEDGTGVTDANSYAAIVAFTTYHEDREHDIDAYDDNQITVAMIEASKYLDIRWGKTMKGYLLIETQGLEFPRNYLYDRYGNIVSGLPLPIAEASILYAFDYLSGSLYPDTNTSSAKDIKKKKTVVGPITTEVEYQGAATDNSYLQFPLADRLVKQYTTSSGSGSVLRN